MACAEVDLTTVTGDFFIGLKGTYDNSISWEITSATTMIFNGNSYNISYEPTTKIFTVNFTDSTIGSWITTNTLTAIIYENNIINYTTSDNIDQYPNKDYHIDGYWYELYIPEGTNVWKKSIQIQPEISYTNPSISVTGEYYGTFLTVTSSTIDFNAVVNMANWQSFFGEFNKYDASPKFSFTYSSGALYYSSDSGQWTCTTIELLSSSSVKINLTDMYYGYQGAYTLTYSGTKYVQEQQLNPQSFIVDSNSSTYPNGEEHTDGYYYELISSI